MINLHRSFRSLPCDWDFIMHTLDVVDLSSIDHDQVATWRRGRMKERERERER